MDNVTRINFSPLTSKTMRWNKIPPKWVGRILNDFQCAYDASFTESLLVQLTSERGIKHIVSWMKSEGFKVNYWELNYGIYTKTQPDPHIIAYGFEIDNQCEKFIELKLRMTDD